MNLRTSVTYALRDGRLERQPCEVCGEAQTVAHHDDYAKPLDVRWLCRSCHGLWHAQNEALNRDLGDLPADDAFLTVRVPQDLAAAINALAEQNERTQAAEIRVALKNHLTASSPTR